MNRKDLKARVNFAHLGQNVNRVFKWKICGQDVIYRYRPSVAVHIHINTDCERIVGSIIADHGSRGIVFDLPTRKDIQPREYCKWHCRLQKIPVSELVKRDGGFNS